MARRSKKERVLRKRQQREQRLLKRAENNRRSQHVKSAVSQLTPQMQHRSSASAQHVAFKEPSIDPFMGLKARLQPVIDEANARWQRLDDMDLRSLAVSRALDESNGQRGFSISQLISEGDIIAEATRARVFMSDKTSTIHGAELYTQQESYRQYLGQFGNQYNNWENKFQRYNTSVINEEQARIAFSAYRRLEESEQARIMSYGSENTIIAIYDMVVKGGYSDAEDSEDITEVTEMARDLLDRELGEKAREFERAFEKSNEVANILNIIEYERSQDEFW